MHLRDYTRELKQRLPRKYFEPVASRLFWLIPNIALVVAGILLITLYDFHLLVKLAISVVMGSSLASLGFLGHEVLHGSVVKNRTLRDLVGTICFAQFNLGPKVWRRWHNVEHHGHTQGEQDPDAMGTLEDYKNRPALRALFAIAPWLRSLITFVAFTFWFSFHSFLMFLRFAPTFPKRKDRIIAVVQFLLPLSLWIGLLVLIGPGNFLFAYVIPVLVANFIVMSYIATNHMLNPLTPVNDPLANSLTVTKWKWMDILHLNFSFHTEHHIFPSMNPKYAPKVKALAKELWPDRYHEMPHWKALVALWRTPRLYHEHGNELADPKRELAFPVLGQGLDPQDMKGTLKPTPLTNPGNESS